MRGTEKSEGELVQYAFFLLMIREVVKFRVLIFNILSRVDCTFLNLPTSLFSNYVCVNNDVAGNFSLWQTDKYDAEDLGNWISMQEWSNGQVMTLGASADGIGSMQTIVNDPEWLAAQYIM